MMKIHGKEYITVNERVTQLREQHPDWTIQTEIISHAEGMIVMVTKILDETGRLIANGHAYEREGSTNVNRTSYIENCETSAVGRALAFVGIGIVESIASAEEVVGAIGQDGNTRTQIVADYARARNGLNAGQVKKLHEKFPDKKSVKDFSDDELLEAINFMGEMSIFEQEQA